MKTITANEANEQSYKNIEDKLNNCIINSIEKGQFKATFQSSSKIPNSIIDKLKKLGYNIKENTSFINTGNFFYFISWE